MLEEAERAEDAILGEYERIIKRVIGNPVNDVLHRQYAAIKKSHDRVRELRDLVRATNA